MHVSLCSEGYSTTPHHQLIRLSVPRWGNSLCVCVGGGRGSSRLCWKEPLLLWSKKTLSVRVGLQGGLRWLGITGVFLVFLQVALLPQKPATSSWQRPSPDSLPGWLVSCSGHSGPKPRKPWAEIPTPHHHCLSRVSEIEKWIPSVRGIAVIFLSASLCVEKSHFLWSGLVWNAVCFVV